MTLSGLRLQFIQVYETKPYGAFWSCERLLLERVNRLPICAIKLRSIYQRPDAQSTGRGLQGDSSDVGQTARSNGEPKLPPTIRELSVLPMVNTDLMFEY
jgi:hypothetical protein